MGCKCVKAWHGSCGVVSVLTVHGAVFRCTEAVPTGVTRAFDDPRTVRRMDAGGPPVSIYNGV